MRYRALSRFSYLLLAVAWAAAGVASAQQSASSPLIVTEKDDGKSVQVMVGQTLAIQLPSNPTTGYQWVLARDLGPLVGGRQRFTPSGANMPGAGGAETFKFLAKETGSVTLTLEYRRPWENDPPTKTFTVTVKVVPCEKGK